VSNLRHAAQRDANEPEIVAALERVGASVTRLNGRGIPDLLVGFCGKTFLLEVKLPVGAKGGLKGRDLNEDQQTWWRKWTGSRLHLVRSPGDALRAIGLEPISSPEVLP
jgi:hypothetical protein